MLIFIFSLLLEFSLIKLLFPFLNKICLDIPNSRSSHSVCKPTGGGLSFVIVDIIFSILLGNYSRLSLIPLASVGFLDDIFKISSIKRYFFQVFTAILILISSTYFPFNNSILLITPYPNLSKIFLFFFFLFFITAIINFINFMDGIDGLVGSCFLVIFFFRSLDGNIFLIPLIGSLVVFLFFNWQPSKIFMGDVGSTYLAAIYCNLIFTLPNMIDSFSFILLGVPILGDAFFTILKRILLGKNIFKAHRDHLYQRLVLAGWGHSKVSIMYTFCTILLAISYKLFGFYLLLNLSIVLLFFGIFLDIKFAKKII